jgi:hypothetical protein
MTTQEAERSIRVQIVNALADANRPLKARDLATRLDTTIETIAANCSVLAEQGHISRRGVYEPSAGKSVFQYALAGSDGGDVPARDHQTPWQQRCPHGHTTIESREMGQNIRGGSVPRAPWYCNSCCQSYETDELTRVERRDVSMSFGSVWTPDGFRDGEVVADE